MTRRLLPVVCILCLGLLGCRQGGSSSAATTTPAPSNAVPQTRLHWQAALSALAAAPQPEALRADSLGIAAWNQHIAAAWPALVDVVTSKLEDTVQKLVGKGGSGYTISQATLVSHAFAQPPAFAGASTASAEIFDLQLPAGSGWDFDLSLRVDYQLFGGSATLQHHADFDVAVSQLAASQSVSVDVSDPLRPSLVAFGTPQLDVQLNLTSSHFAAGPLLNALSGLLDILLRAELDGLVQDIAQQLLALGTGPGAQLGAGGPALSSWAGPRVDLESLAVEVGAALVADHLYQGMVFDVQLDAPVYGQGQVLQLWGMGDSAFWTGHWLAALAYRYALDPDPVLEQQAQASLEAIGRCLDVSPQGQLSRVAVPLASPFAAPLFNDGRVFVAQIQGSDWVGLDDVSRDQYVGVLFGLGRVALHMPGLRPAVAPLVNRLLDYLESHGWNAFHNDGTTLAANFAQSPFPMLGLLQTAKFTDPARWGPVFDHYSPILSVAWLPTWFGLLNTHEEYYKHNLGHDSLVSLCELETSPDVYRHYLQVMRLQRTALAHHQNAWFDAVYAMGVPTEAASVGPAVEDGLQRWAARPRRGFAVYNSADPSIPQTLFHFLSPSDPPEVIASIPVPVEKRRYTDYLWQRSPFSLDGAWPETFQAPGLDLLLPYWFSRVHGIF